MVVLGELLPFYNLLDIGSMAKCASLPNQGFCVVFDLPAKDVVIRK